MRGAWRLRHEADRPALAHSSRVGDDGQHEPLVADRLVPDQVEDVVADEAADALADDLSYEERGVSEDEAEERAARTVNRERAEAGETRAARERGGGGARKKRS